MDNLTAARALCNSICSSFHPDDNTVAVVLFNEGINPMQQAVPKDKALMGVVLKLVGGYVEQSRSEGGISVSVNTEAINKNIIRWCEEYGLDAGDYIEVKTIENGSNLW